MQDTEDQECGETKVIEDKERWILWAVLEMTDIECEDFFHKSIIS